MHAYGGGRVYPHTLLTVSLNGGECLALCRHCLSLKERNWGASWEAGHCGQCDEEKNLPCQELNMCTVL